MPLASKKRKIPFQDIRKEALIKNKDLLRIKNDAFYEELSESEICAELEKISEDIRGTHDEIKQRLKSFQRKRHWLIWHDHSTLSNYGHMLFCVREMYDPAIHLSDAEARVQYGKDVDVQATVERPYLYMLGQSSSSIEDQIKFVPARHDDLVNLTQKVKTEEDVEVEDEMRFMNGDNPAANFECGNQHGGHYGCPGCDGHLSMCHDLDYMAQRKYRTLTERQQLVLAGRKGKEAKQLLNPFQRATS